MALSFAALSIPVSAQTTWNSAVDGEWNDSSKWSNGIPQANAALINSTGATYQLLYSSPSGYNSFTDLLISNSGGNTSTLAIAASGFGFTGNLNLNSGGRIRIGNGGVMSQTGSGTSSIASAGGLTVESGGASTLRALTLGGSLQVNSGGTFSNAGGNLTTQGTASITNAGTFTSGNTLNLQGGTVVNTGTFNANADNSLLIGNENSASFTMNGGSLSASTKSTSALRGIAVGSVFGGNNAVGTFTMNAGTATNKGSLIIGVVSSNTANRTVTGNFTMTGGTWTNSEADRQIVVGAYAANAGGTVSGANINGSLKIQGSLASFQSAGNIIVGAGGANGLLEVSSGSLTLGSGASLQLGVAGTVLNANGVSTVGKGTLTMTGGDVSVDSLIAQNGTNSIVNLNGGNLTVNSANINNGTTFNVGNGTLNAVLKMSSATGTYTFANGVNVKTNATLNGQGNLSGSLTVSGTLLLADTNSVGTLAAGSVSLEAGAATYFDILAGGVNHDLLSGSAITFGGTLNLNFTGSFSNGSSFQLFDFSSYNSNFNSIAWSGLDGGQQAVFDTESGYITVVPEPSATVLVLVGMGVLLLFRNKRARVSAATSEDSAILL